MYAVEVKFQNAQDDKTWTYLVDDSIRLAANCYVVVPMLESYVFKVVVVKNVIANPTIKPGIKYRWVVQKVNFKIYKKCLRPSESTATATETINSLPQPTPIPRGN